MCVCLKGGILDIGASLQKAGAFFVKKKKLPRSVGLTWMHENRERYLIKNLDKMNIGTITVWTTLKLAITPK